MPSEECIPLDQDYLDLFWQFVFERQSIWDRRVRLGLPGPWTDDPTLRHERFTNVYRELDPGTQYALLHILERSESKPDKLFNVMLYRLIGRASTHAYLGFQHLSDFESGRLESRLKELRDSGAAPFTAAYMVSAYSSLGSADKIANVAKLFDLLRARFDELFKDVSRSKELRDVHALLSSIYGFGNFLSYQVLVDAMYPLQVYGGGSLLPFSPDDWASPGPGAQRGIQILLQSNRSISSLEVMRWLRLHQASEFIRLGLDFPYLQNRDGTQRELSLANIQNCLCEFHKYVKIREGTGRGRRKFKGAQTVQDVQQLHLMGTSFLSDNE